MTNKFSRVTLIILPWLSLFSCTELYNVDMVRDIRNHFYSKWIIIQSCSKTDHQVIRLKKEIDKLMNIYTNIFTWEDFLMHSERENNLKPLVLLSCWSCPLNCLQQINELNRKHVFVEFIWLMVKDRDQMVNIADLVIPLNSNFIVCERQHNNSFTLIEIYRLSATSEIIFNEIGDWNVKDGLNFTSVPLEIRRSDFKGQNITTLVEPPDSLNRLIVIYDHYAPCFWDLAKRLNFTVHNVTDADATFEVSIIMSFFDISSNAVYLQPLHTSWLAIFFKDIGVNMQIGGYLKPFKSTVWFAILSLILLAGLLSYVSSTLLYRITKTKMCPFRLDTHIYQSFYILLQKSETTEQFISQRIITLSQWIISICIISCYSAIFISFVSVVIPKPPFTTVDGILDEGKHNIVTAKHLSPGAMGFFEITEDVKLRALYEKHFDPVKGLRDNVVHDFCLENNYIFVTSELHMRKIRADPEYKYCIISQSHIRIMIRHLTWSVQKNCQYERHLRFYLNKLNLAGVLMDCFTQRSTYKNVFQPSSFRGIAIEDVLILFIIVAAGILISCVIFCFELVYHKFKKFLNFFNIYNFTI